MQIFELKENVSFAKLFKPAQCAHNSLDRMFKAKKQWYNSQCFCIELKDENVCVYPWNAYSCGDFERIIAARTVFFLLHELEC